MNYLKLKIWFGPAARSCDIVDQKGAFLDHECGCGQWTQIDANFKLKFQFGPKTQKVL
jgi:hypothetical protein